MFKDSDAVKHVLLFCALGLAFIPSTSMAERWYKGNIHTHTVNSDGNTSPTHVVQWYKENGFQFVFLTDHDIRTPVEGLNQLYSLPDQFHVFPGVEVTDRFNNRPVHLVGLGVNASIKAAGGKSVEETIDSDALGIKQAKGVAYIAHPNGFLPAALTASELASSQHANIFEMCCSDYLGGSGFPSTEQLWDEMLTGGKRIYGVAADDAHDFSPGGKDPGKAWIMVKAEHLTQEDILAGISNGEFYSSTGVELTDINYSEQQLCITISDEGYYGYRTHFIGANGDVLKTDQSHTPCYDLPSDRQYVRARVERSDGAIAWSQPVFSKR